MYITMHSAPRDHPVYCAPAMCTEMHDPNKAWAHFPFTAQKNLPIEYSSFLLGGRRALFSPSEVAAMNAFC